jgi:UDP-N-acetylglucosamine 2-epimerase (non-hydrolysing)
MIHLVIGTRAQLIKMLPLMQRMQKRGWAYNFVFLAQHKSTILDILDEFGLKHPDHVIADDGQDIVKTLQMIRWSLRVLASGFWHRKRIFRADRSGIALVHGDAPPLLLGALIAKAQGLQVAQVEAGLRSFRWFAPFPEEITRWLTARLGLIDLHLCQDENALQNAMDYSGRVILTSGNTIVDTLQMVSIEGTPGEPYALVSLHRYETLTNAKRMAWIVELLLSVARGIEVIVILHPPTMVALQQLGLIDRLRSCANIDLVPRMTFSAFQLKLRHAAFLISDGGSNQEESAYLGVPCLLMRDTTERREGLGENVVVSRFDAEVIENFLTDPSRFSQVTRHNGPSPTDVILDAIADFA